MTAKPICRCGPGRRRSPEPVAGASPEPRRNRPRHTGGPWIHHAGGLAADSIVAHKRSPDAPDGVVEFWTNGHREVAGVVRPLPNSWRGHVPALSGYSWTGS